MDGGGDRDVRLQVGEGALQACFAGEVGNV
jgi:hypothetical protein